MGSHGRTVWHAKSPLTLPVYLHHISWQPPAQQTTALTMQQHKFKKITMHHLKAEWHPGCTYHAREGSSNEEQFCTCRTVPCIDKLFHGHLSVTWGASAPILPGLAILRVPPECALPQLRGCVHCGVHPGIRGCVRCLQRPAALQLQKRLFLDMSSRHTVSLTPH